MSENMDDIIKLEAYRLKSLDAAICCYRFKNPARQKFANTLELDHGGRPLVPDFTAGNPSFVWCEICGAINAILCELDRDRRAAFEYCVIGSESGERIHPITYGRAIGRCEKTINRWLGDTRQRLERELELRGFEFLPPT
jgi:hypothetical protein